MRLYSRMNATAVDHPEYGHFEPVDDGGFDFPDEVADELHRFHHRGKPAWETVDERNQRLHGEESARRRDPETLYNAVADIAGMARQLAGQQPAPGLSSEIAAELAELRRQLAELQAANPAPAQEDAGAKVDQPAAKPSRSTSKAAKSADTSGGNS